MARAILLEAKDLAYGAPGGPLLAEDLNFRVASGGVLLISGPNGSGKTTLLNVLLGRQRPRRGNVRWDTDRRALGYLPQVQDSEVHLPFTLRDVLRTGDTAAAFDEGGALALGLLEKRHLGLAWNRASGGERKRALLTRLFLARPRIVVLDEPFNHLDRASRELITASLRAYLEEPDTGRMAILVSHEQLLEDGLSGLPTAKVSL